MYKINLFNADREMSNRVVEFMEKNVWSIAERRRVKDEIATLQKKHEGLKKALASSLKEDVFKEMLDCEAKISALDSKLAEDLKGNKFEYSEADKALYKGYREGNLVFALRDWFKQYNLTVAESNLEKDLRDALGGKMPAGRQCPAFRQFPACQGIPRHGLCCTPAPGCPPGCYSRG